MRTFTGIQTSGLVSPDVAAPRALLQFLLFLFFVSCVFDPADVTIGAKVWLFAVLWLVTLATVSPRSVLAPALYVLIFIAVPLLSILVYFLTDGSQPFEGFVLIKTYFLVSLTLVILIGDLDPLPVLSAILTLLACATIAIFVMLRIDPGRLAELHDIGDAARLFYLGHRFYGDLDQVRIFFATSVLLVIPLAYYLDRALTCAERKRRQLYAFLIAIILAGLILSGTRANIIAAIVLPNLIWPMYARRPALCYSLMLLLLVAAALSLWSLVAPFFAAEEYANNIKINLVQDYLGFFDVRTLLIGQGLGAYRFWTGTGEYRFNSELTYLEMIRCFGLPGAAIIMGLVVVPVLAALQQGASRRFRVLILAYMAYLVESVSNPNLFTSSGMIFLSIVLAMSFQLKDVSHENDPS